MNMWTRGRRRREAALVEALKRRKPMEVFRGIPDSFTAELHYDESADSPETDSVMRKMLQPLLGDARRNKMEKAVSLAVLLEYKRDKTLAELRTFLDDPQYSEHGDALKLITKEYADRSRNIVEQVRKADYRMYIPDAGTDLDKCLEIIADERKLASSSYFMIGHDIEYLSDSKIKLTDEGGSRAVALASLSGEYILDKIVKHDWEMEMVLKDAGWKKGHEPSAKAEDSFQAKKDEDLSDKTDKKPLQEAKTERQDTREDKESVQESKNFGMGLPDLPIAIRNSPGQNNSISDCSSLLMKEMAADFSQKREKTLPYATLFTNHEDYDEQINALKKVFAMEQETGSVFKQEVLEAAIDKVEQDQRPVQP